MKVLIVSDLGPPFIGGIESYILNLGEGLARKGVEVHWAFSNVGGKKEERLNGINIHRIPILFSNRPEIGRYVFALTAPFSLLKIARKMDVVHYNTFIPGVFGLFVSKIAKKPSLLYVHEFWGDLWKKIGQNGLERNFFPRVEWFMRNLPYNRFACPSEYTKQCIVQGGIEPEGVSVIPHGIGDFFKPTKKTLRKRYGLERNFIIGYSGRLSLEGTGQAKNILGLLVAFKIVSEKIPSARLLFGGSGFDSLRPHIKRLGIEKMVVYTGQRPHKDVPYFLSSCDVIVCPSVSDGFCFLLAEAGACGVPVIATNRGSHPERVADGKNGLLSGTRPEELAGKLIYLYKDPRKRRLIGLHGRKVASKLSWDASVKAHLDVYSELYSFSVK